MFSLTVARPRLAISFAFLSFFANAAPVLGQSGALVREPFVVGLGPFAGGGGWVARRGDDPDYEARTWAQLPWPAYTASGGAVHPAMGDVDADGRDEIILGVGAGGNGWIAVLDDAGSNHALLSWIQLPWPTYNATNGATYPAAADVDGDGRAEILVGLGTGASGWFAVFDDARAGFAMMGWQQVQWPTYTAGDDGSTRVAGGDLNGDGRAEIVVGLGAGSNGWLEVFGSAQTSFAHQSWIQVPWPTYAAANGSAFPAVGDLDHDGRDEIVAGLGRGSNGWLAIFQDGNAAYAFDRWVQLPWTEYNSAVGESHPAVGNVDADPAAEILVGLDRYANEGGWFAIFDDLTAGAGHVAWRNVEWADFRAAGGATFPAIGRTNDGLLAAYAFDGSGADASGNGRHASVSHTSISPNRFGQLGRAYRFNGVNSLASISGLPAFTGDFTIAFWQKAGPSERMHAMSLGNTADDHLDISVNDGSAVLSYWNSPAAGLSYISTGTPNEVTDNAWHHLALRRIGSTVEVYVDGVFRGASTASGALTTSGLLRIGRGSYSGWWWNGLIDDVAVYGRALSAAELNTLSGDRPLIAVRAPIGAEQWTSGTTREIVWSVHSSVATITLQYSIDNGATWETIASSVSAALRTYTWTVPSFTNRFALVRIVDAANGQTISPIETFVILNGANNLWQQTTSNAPWGPRDGVGSYVFNGKMWMVGGWHPGDPNTYREIWTSTNGTSWTFEGYGPFAGTHACGCVVFNNRMWIYTGDGLPDIWSSNDGVNWTLETSNAPWGGRYRPYVVVHNNRVWLMGGADSITGEPFNDVWSSPDGVTWTRELEHAPWVGRGTIHGSAVFGGKIWLLGGAQYAHGSVPETHFNDVWTSSNGVDWTRVTSSAPWSPRMHHTVAVYADRLWVMAGHVLTPEDPNSPVRLLNDVWSSLDGITWTEVQEVPWVRRHAAAPFVYNDTLFLAAGFLVNDVWKLKVAGNISIADGAESTSSATVTLSMAPPDPTIDSMQFSNDGVSWSPSESYERTRVWSLTAGAGTKTVYVRFRRNGAWGPAYKDEIVYNGS